jgi:DNA-binding CsgD family transcriptional regulator
MIEELRGRKAAGLKLCLKGGAIQKRIGAPGDYADTMLRVGMIHLAKNRLDDAVDALRDALAAAVDSSIAKTESEIHEALADAYERLGEHEQAYRHLRRHAVLAAEILGAERSRIVAEMGARFDLERAERERELFRERSRHLEELADQRSRQLTAAATHLVKKNSLLGGLHHDLSRLGERQEPSRTAVNALLRRIEENLRSEDDWRRFEETYSLVHHDFLQTLSHSFPALSAMELRICALLKMSLSNKEIADILSISVRTIESHRYRIRKKLGLGNEANLAAHLAGM